MERENVAKEIEGYASHLARVMEMEYSLEDTKRDPNQHSNPAFTLISDYVMREEGTRFKLAEYLRETGFTRASIM